MEVLWRRVPPTLALGYECMTLTGQHPVIRALREGLDFQGQLWTRIVEPFSSDKEGAKAFVKALWKGRQTTWAGIMARLDVQRDDDVDMEITLRWVACLKRYLQALPPRENSEMDSEESIALTRPERFALAMSETPYLPKNNYRKFVVRSYPFKLYTIKMMSTSSLSCVVAAFPFQCYKHENSCFSECFAFFPYGEVLKMWR